MRSANVEPFTHQNSTLAKPRLLRVAVSPCRRREMHRDIIYSACVPPSPPDGQAIAYAYATGGAYGDGVGVRVSDN